MKPNASCLGETGLGEREEGREREGEDTVANILTQECHNYRF